MSGFESREPIPYVAKWTDPRSYQVKTEEGVLNVGEKPSDILDKIRIRENL